MSTIKAICMIVKCEECGHENAKLIPLEIREENWRKTHEKYGEMISHYL